LTIDLPIPDRLKEFMKGEKQTMAIGNDFGEFRKLLNSKIEPSGT
jgi:threonine synthase